MLQMENKNKGVQSFSAGNVGTPSNYLISCNESMRHGLKKALKLFKDNNKNTFYANLSEPGKTRSTLYALDVSIVYSAEQQ